MAVATATAVRAGAAVAQSKSGRYVLMGVAIALVGVVMAPAALMAAAMTAVISTVGGGRTSTAAYNPPGQAEHDASEAWAGACSSPLVDGAYIRATIYVETGWNPVQSRDGRYGLSNTTPEEWEQGVIAVADNAKFKEITLSTPDYTWAWATEPARSTGPMHVAVLAELVCQAAATLPADKAADRSSLAAALAHRGADPTNFELPHTEDRSADYIAAVLGAWDAQQEQGTASDGELPAQDTYAEGLGADIVAAARKHLGLPYVWGGGNVTGPTGGGFDCSGLTLYAVYAATGGKVRLSRTAQAQGGEQVEVYYGSAGGLDLDTVAAGDLIAFKMKTNHRRGSGDRAYTHVGIYAGDGLMIHAPRPGKKVEVVSVTDYWINPTYTQNLTVRRIAP